MDQNKQATPNTNPQEKQAQNQQAGHVEKPVQPDTSKEHDKKDASPTK